MPLTLTIPERYRKLLTSISMADSKWLEQSCRELSLASNYVGHHLIWNHFYDAEISRSNAFVRSHTAISVARYVYIQNFSEGIISLVMVYSVAKQTTGNALTVATII